MFTPWRWKYYDFFINLSDVFAYMYSGLVMASKQSTENLHVFGGVASSRTERYINTPA